MTFHYASYLITIPLWMEAKGIFQNVEHVTNWAIFTKINRVSTKLPTNNKNGLTKAVINHFHKTSLGIKRNFKSYMHISLSMFKSFGLHNICSERVCMQLFQPYGVLSNTYQYDMIHQIIPCKLAITCKVFAPYKNHQENLDCYTTGAVNDLVLIHVINELNLMEELATVASKAVNEMLCSSVINC